MSDRAVLFLFSVVVVLASLAAAVWLLATGQAASVDGLFLLLTCLLLAFSFGLYLAFLVRRAMQAVSAPAPKAASAAAKPAPSQVQPEQAAPVS